VEGTVPNAVGATAIFNAPSATRTVNIDNGDAIVDNITVGSITIDNQTSARTTIRSNSGNSGIDTLTFDAAGAGPALITSTGTATGNDIISQRFMIFADSVTANITGVGNAAGFSMTGNINGPGGLTKEGPGTLTLAFIAGSSGQVKNYEGPTVVDAGRLRLSQGGAPSMTSSVTVNSGGQILLITGVAGTNTGIYTFGTSPSTVVTLNGTGRADEPGALRLATANAPPTVVTNVITLATNSSVNVNGDANILRLENFISGPGGLTMGALGNAADNGTLVLTGANTYAGGTTVNLGTLALEGSAATLGSGNVTVEGLAIGAAGFLEIRSGVLDAISNAATLTLTGGSGGTINLPESATNEVVAGLVLGGMAQPAGVYTSGSHPLFITGLGSITVAAPPANNADFDSDGDVDGNDFLIWQRGVGLTAQPDKSTGDADGDMDVDANDLAIFKSKFGGPPAVPAAGSVPEPSALAMAALLMTTPWARFRRVR